MSETLHDIHADEVPARFLEYESRALTYRSDARKLGRALLITTVACGGLAAFSLLVGERTVLDWARSSASSDKLTHDVETYLCRAPRFLMYPVIALLFIIGRDRKQRFWMHVALIVLVLELVFAGALVRILKIVIGRARPYTGKTDFRPFLLTWNSYHSLPSGDAADVATSVSFFIYFARRRSAWVIPLVMLVMVMFERVMNGHHYPSDVLAGAYIGLVSSFIVWHWFVVGFPLKKLRAWLGQDQPPPAAADAEEPGQ